MDGWDDTDDLDLLVAAATVLSARRRVRAALGPLAEDRHRVPTPPGADPSFLVDVLGPRVAAESHTASEHLASALSGHDPASPAHR